MFCIHCGQEMADHSKFCPKCGIATSTSNASASAAATNSVSTPSSTTNPTPPSFVPATAGIRLLNYIIDSTALTIIAVVAVISVSIIMILFEQKGINPIVLTIVQQIISLGMILVSVLFYILFEGIWGRTPGKFLTDTKVVMKDGSKPDWKHVIGRSFARMIPFEPLSFLFSPVGWHDSLSGTMVVSDKYTAEQIQQIIVPPQKKSGLIWLIIGIVIFIFISMIIAIIAAVILLAANSARSEARDTHRLADVRQLHDALETYHTDNGSYPDSIEELIPDYLASVPTAPTPADGNCAEKNDYKYESLSVTYKIRFCLGSETSDISAGEHYISPEGIDKNQKSNTEILSEVEKADYEEGYKSGYSDGRGEKAEFGDNYNPPATVSRRHSYIQGYKDGITKGCDEGGFDCTDGIQYLEEELNGIPHPDDSQPLER